MKQEAENYQLADSQSKPPHLSLRNLSRALNYCVNNKHLYDFERVLYDGLYLGFGSSLGQDYLNHFHKALEGITKLNYPAYLSKL